MPIWKASIREPTWLCRYWRVYAQMSGAKVLVAAFITRQLAELFIERVYDKEC